MRILVERLGGDADVGFAGQHPFGDLGRAALVHFQFDLRVLGHEIAHDERQRVARLGMRRGQDQAAAIAGGKLAARPFQILGLAQDAFGNVQHHLAGLGNASEALAAALEDGDAEFVLQQLDLLGDAGLGGIKRFRRLGDIEPLTLDFDDVA